MYVRPAHGMNVYRTLSLLPDFFSDFFYEGYFGPLLLSRQKIAFFRGGKATLRAEAYLIDGQVGRGLTNPFDDKPADLQVGRFWMRRVQGRPADPS